MVHPSPSYLVASPVSDLFTGRSIGESHLCASFVDGKAFDL